MMTAGDSNSAIATKILIIAVSVVANGCLYGVVGLVVGGILEKVAAKR